MMNNYTDLSSSGAEVDAGFQFEFSCQSCGETWRSAFKPYRRGQLAGWLERLSYLIGGSATFQANRGAGGLASLGWKDARESALGQALGQARQLYSECGSCRKVVCRKCWNAQSGQCNACAGEMQRGAHLDGARAAAPAAGGLACPSCGQGTGGGRFCEACGFDLAATHKSCPGCGTMVTRQARFCADCGHGF